MIKRTLCLALVVVLCVSLTACSGAPSGTYTDESGMISFTFTDGNVSASAYGDVVATGTYTVKGDQVKLTFTGEFADYLNALNALTYDASADTLTDSAGSVLYKAK